MLELDGYNVVVEIITYYVYICSCSNTVANGKASNKCTLKLITFVLMQAYILTSIVFNRNIN